MDISRWSTCRAAVSTSSGARTAAQFVPIETAIDLIKQVCRGITQAHREKPPIIHRDIKPQNILVGYEADGLRARVSDFGLAKKVNPLTLLATAAGTLAFKPPEAFSEHKGDSCAADVWAIGATLYLLLTDRLPFEMPANVSWGSKNLFDKPVSPPSETNPDVRSSLGLHRDEGAGKTSRRPLSDSQGTFDRLGRLATGDHRRNQRRKALSSEPSKAAGHAITADEEIGEDLAQKALKARQAGRLAEAADLMEEAFNKSPELRQKYAHQVKLWRCGISM